MPEEVELSGEEQAAPKTYRPKVCANKGCGKTFTPKSGRTKQCDDCKANEDVQKGINRDHKAESRARNTARENVANSQPTSTVEIKVKDAKELLADLGMRNARAIEVCVEHAEAAARVLASRGVRFNHYLIKHGVQATLAKLEGRTYTPPVAEDVWNPGERLREHELLRVWDFVASWRVQPDGTSLSFEQWKEYRRRSITDIVWFANTVLGKTFEQEPHGRWATEIFPNLEPALLSLPEKFTETDIASAFNSATDIRQRCLISARSSFKSTFSTVFSMQMNLAFAGSIRIMVCTATQPLAKGFAKSFRSMLTLRDPLNATLMNQLWPEHCVAPDEGKSMEYTSPFRQLTELIEPTLGVVSIISEGTAGMRFDYCVMDDVAEISNSSSPEMREKTQERVDMLRELASPHSWVTYVGTPISPGMGTNEDPGDLYSVLLRREEKNLQDTGEPKLLWTICPAWSVKPGISKKAWDSTLREDEVDLLFPSRLTFKYLMSKLKENLATDTSAKIFRQQSLVSWVPDDETQITMTFTEAALRSRFRHRGFFDSITLPGTPVYIAYDDAWSAAATADFSTVAVVRVQPVMNEQSVIPKKQDALVVLDVDFGRWKLSEKIAHIVRVIEKYKPSAWVLEKDRGYDELVLGVRKMCYQTSVPMPHVVLRDVKNTPRAKAAKVKVLEAPLVDGRLYFASGSWNDAMVQQFIRFDGVKKSGSSDGSKDDIPDAIALAYSTWGPRAEIEPLNPEEQLERNRLQEEEDAEYLKRAQYERMFGSRAYTPPSTPQPVFEPEKPRDPRLRIFGKGPWRV